jgi:hypothetical protein
MAAGYPLLFKTPLLVHGALLAALAYSHKKLEWDVHVGVGAMAVVMAMGCEWCE